jgi:hypothetical protein
MVVAWGMDWVNSSLNERYYEPVFSKVKELAKRGQSPRRGVQ